VAGLERTVMVGVIFGVGNNYNALGGAEFLREVLATAYTC
jgi:hypothetical protein